jgi:hypothetical protein
MLVNSLTEAVLEASPHGSDIGNISSTSIGKISSTVFFLERVAAS